jgi:hypothetical protein
MKNYLEFGFIQNNKKKVYEIKYGSVYDWYMFSRYFNDILILDKSKKNLKKIYYNLHHRDDIRFNFINYIFLKIAKNKKIYEIGQTLLEKIYFIDFFQKLFDFRFQNKIKWRGNDISEMFNFFCNNFHNQNDVKVDKFINFEEVKNSIFFAKGITLLYIKKNISILKKILKYSKMGSFDISINKNKQIKILNTGKQMHFAGYLEFLKLFKNKNKKFLFKNFMFDKNKKIYVEIIYGDREYIENFLKEFKFYKSKFANDAFTTKALGLNYQFYDFDQFQKKINYHYN